MAGDWIKMRTDLYRDPKVCLMADNLMAADGELSMFINHQCRRDMTVTRNVMRNVTVGALVSVWGVLRHRGSRDGDDLLCSGATSALVDDIADLPGFGEAMMSVGWLVETEAGIVFPKFFSTYNTDPEESLRRSNAQRQARYRSKSNVTSNASRNVTRNVTVTPREEKRREEIVSLETSSPKKHSAVFLKPSVDDIRAYCEERKSHVDAQQFFDFYESKGWMVGRNKMRDWKACVRTWEKSDGGGSTGNQPRSGGHRESPARYDGTFEADFAEVRRRNEALQAASGGAAGSGPDADPSGISECG